MKISRWSGVVDDVTGCFLPMMPANERPIITQEQRDEARREEARDARAEQWRETYQAALEKQNIYRLTHVDVPEVSLLSAPARPANRWPLLMWKAETPPAIQEPDGFDLDAEAGEAGADAELGALAAIEKWNAGAMAASDLLTVLREVPLIDDAAIDAPEPTSRAHLTKRETSMLSNTDKLLRHTTTRLTKSDGPLGTLADLGAAITEELALAAQRQDPFLTDSEARGVALRKSQWPLLFAASPFAHEPAREGLVKWEEIDPQGFARLCAEAGVRGVVVPSDGATLRLAKLRQIFAPMSSGESYGAFRSRISRSISEEVER